MRRSIKSLALGVSLLMAGAGAAQAELVTFQVTATIDSVDDQGYLLGGSIQAGDQITGTYIIDTATPDEDPSVEYARYRHNAAPGIGFDLSAGGHRFATAPTSNEFAVEIADASWGDRHGVVSFTDNEPLANGTRVDGIMIDLYDSSGTANTSTALLSTAPSLAAFNEKKLFIDGAAPDYTNWFHIDATVTSITGGGTGQATGPVTHQVKAVIEYIYDPNNKLSNVATGDVITANYTFDPATPDMDPAVEYGHYVHAQVPGFGFEVTLGADLIKTDSAAAEFTVHLENSYSDFRDVVSFGSHTPLSTGATVDFIGVHLFDPSGTALQSAELTAEVPALTTFQELKMDIGGPEFSVYARVIAIETLDNTPVILSPAAGTYDRFQEFDGAFIFDPGVHPAHIGGSVNGMDVTPFFEGCMPGAPNEVDRFTLVCPGLSGLLMPGANQLSVDVELDDGTVYQDTFTYEILGY